MSSWLPRLSLVAVLVDLVSIALSVVIGMVGRHSLGMFAPAPTTVIPSALVAVPAIAAGGLLAIAAIGGYQQSIFGAGTDEFRRVARGWFATAAIIGIGCYLLRYALPRGFFLIMVAAGLLLLVAGRYALRLAIKSVRRRGALQHRVLIVGSDVHVDEVADVLGRESWLGYDVVAALTPHHRGASTSNGVPVIGNPSQVALKAIEAEADVVFVAGGAVDSAAQLREIAWQLEHSSIQLVVAPSVTDVAAERVTVRPVGGLPLIHLGKPRSAGAVRRAKRLFDAFGSFFLLLVAAPVFVFAMYKIRRFDGGPVIFRQTRIGRDGQPFEIWKFRTMVTDAEQLLARLHAEQGYDQGLFKMAEDPRVTAPGRWLRRFSLDELPQLINVLRGDMSLVGPRPPLADEVAQYDDTMSRRLHVRPGMTGLWQVSGRSDLSWSEAIRLDLYYVDNWSMLQDLSILARTFGAVVGSRGAY